MTHSIHRCYFLKIYLRMLRAVNISHQKEVSCTMKYEIVCTDCSDCCDVFA